MGCESESVEAIGWGWGKVFTQALSQVMFVVPDAIKYVNQYPQRRERKGLEGNSRRSTV